MDIKATQSKYSLVCGCKTDYSKIAASFMILKNSSIAHEYRTTLCNMLLPKDVMEMIRFVTTDSNSNYYLQICNGTDSFSEHMCVSQEEWRNNYLPVLGDDFNKKICTRGFR